MSMQLQLPSSSKLTEVAMLLPGNLTLEEWKSLGRELGRANGSMKWWVGDWMLFGDLAFKVSYEDAMELTGYSYSTVVKACWLVRRMPPERRRPALSWYHHSLVGTLEVEQQDEWLQRAEEGKWNTRRLDEEIRASQQRPVQPWLSRKKEATVAKEAASEAPSSTRSQALGKPDPEWLPVEISPEAYGALCAMYQRHKQSKPNPPLSFRGYTSRLLIKIDQMQERQEQAEREAA